MGQRGFGVTYLAYDEELCQEVVLKKYRWEHGSLDNEVINKRDYYKKQRKAFLNEARILSSLFDIKEVVKVLDYFEERRTSSPYKKATTGKLTNGDAIYYGDILQVTYSTLTNWTIDSHGKEKITVTGNVTSADIYMTVWSDWSEWPDDADTESNTVKVESKSQYRYSDKATTTSTNASLPGWIQTGSTTSYGGWGSWSVWQTNAIGGSDTRQVETATVYPYYYFYCKSCGRGSRYPYYGSTCAYCNSSSYVTLDTGTVDWFTNSWSSSTRWGSTSKYYQYIYDYHAGANAIYWNWTDGNAQTGYRYRDRSKTITYSYYKWNDWSLNVMGNMAYNKNKIEDLGGVDRMTNPDDGDLWRFVGKPIDSYYVYKADGFFQSDAEAQQWMDTYKGKDGYPFGQDFQAGDLRYVDTNGDGKLDADDRVLSKTINPVVTFGLNLNVGYKAFDLTLNFTGAANVGRAFTKEAFGEFSGSAGHPSTAWLDSWTPENTNASMPRVAESRKSPSEASNVMSDFWVINTSYLRLKTLQLGYTLPKSVLNAIGLSNVRVYYSAENLFTIDSMPLNVDPETVSSRLSSYPLVMTNSFGVNVTF